MDGFKNTTKTQYSMGGYAKGNSVMGRPDMDRSAHMGKRAVPTAQVLPAQAAARASQAMASRPTMHTYKKGGEAKFGKVMSEFKAGTLHSGSKKGAEVTNPKQAVAIALSEARKAGAKSPMKKQAGGAISDAVRRQLETEINDMGPADRARALKMLGRTPESMPAPKKSAPVASRKPYVPSITEGAGDEALIAARKRGMSPGYKKGGMADLKQDKAMVKKAVHKHEAAMHPGKPMTKLRKGGMPC